MTFYLFSSAVVLLATTPPAAPAPTVAVPEHYYVLVFGSQRPIINQARYTHSYALFVRVTGEPGTVAVIDQFAVSWMPATLEVRPLKPHPEPGVNLTIFQSLDWARSECLRTSMWGPYEIDKCFYDRAVEKFARLESGAVRYKAADIGYNSAYVSNCIHALADISQGPRLRIAQPGWGESASYFVTLTYLPFMINPEQKHDWLLGPLGLEHYELVRRDIEDNPTRHLLLRGAQNLRQFRLRNLVDD